MYIGMKKDGFFNLGVKAYQSFRLHKIAIHMLLNIASRKMCLKQLRWRQRENIFSFLFWQADQLDFYLLMVAKIIHKFPMDVSINSSYIYSSLINNLGINYKFISSNLPYNWKPFTKE